MSARAIRTFLATIFIASWLSAATPPDSEAAKLLRGSWAVPVEQYGGVIKDGGYTFQANGDFTSFTVLPGHGQDLRVDVEGRWSIKDGILIETVTKSSQPDIVRPGLTTRDTLLSVTEKEYRFREEDGKMRSRLRTTARALSKAAAGGPQIVDPAHGFLSYDLEKCESHDGRYFDEDVCALAGNARSVPRSRCIYFVRGEMAGT